MKKSFDHSRVVVIRKLPSLRKLQVKEQPQSEVKLEHGEKEVCEAGFKATGVVQRDGTLGDGPGK